MKLAGSELATVELKVTSSHKHRVWSGIGVAVNPGLQVRMVMLTGAEVPRAPASSVAMAVST